MTWRCEIKPENLKLIMTMETNSNDEELKAAIMNSLAAMSGDDAEMFSSAVQLPGVGSLLPQMCVMLAGVVHSAAQVMLLRSYSDELDGEDKASCDHTAYAAIEVFDAQLARFKALLGVVEASTQGDLVKAVTAAKARFVEASDKSEDIMQRILDEARKVDRACGIEPADDAGGE